MDQTHLANYTAIGTTVNYNCDSSGDPTYLESDRARTSFSMTCNGTGDYEKQEEEPNCVESKGNNASLL